MINLNHHSCRFVLRSEPSSIVGPRHPSADFVSCELRSVERHSRQPERTSKVGSAIAPSRVLQADAMPRQVRERKAPPSKTPFPEDQPECSNVHLMRVGRDATRTASIASRTRECDRWEGLTEHSSTYMVGPSSRKSYCRVPTSIARAVPPFKYPGTPVLARSYDNPTVCLHKHGSG